MCHRQRDRESKHTELEIKGRCRTVKKIAENREEKEDMKKQGEEKIKRNFQGDQ